MRIIIQVVSKKVKREQSVNILSSFDGEKMRNIWISLYVAFLCKFLLLEQIWYYSSGNKITKELILLKFAKVITNLLLDRTPTLTKSSRFIITYYSSQNKNIFSSRIIWKKFKLLSSNFMKLTYFYIINTYTHFNNKIQVEFLE